MVLNVATKLELDTSIALYCTDSGISSLFLDRINSRFLIAKIAMENVCAEFGLYVVFDALNDIFIRSVNPRWCPLFSTIIAALSPHWL